MDVFGESSKTDRDSYLDNIEFLNSSVLFQNKTRGLLGKWNFDIVDDMINPDGQQISGTNLNHFEDVHKNFAVHWMLEDKEDDEKGGALFTREFGRTASFYSNRTFEPEWRRAPADILPANR